MDVFVCPTVEWDDVASDYVVDFCDDVFVGYYVEFLEVGEDGEEVDVEYSYSVLYG